MEGAHQIATGELVSLSEEQLVACSYSYGNLGCGGGLMDNAFTYAETHAMLTEDQYPYTSWAGSTSCQHQSEQGVVTVTGFTDVTLNSPEALKAALDKQPVSVAIEADTTVFQSYTGGVITGSACGTNLDHGVLAVGYGVEADGTEYYLVKNSWGGDWGLDGYVKIGVEDGAGVCGIQSGPPSYPSV